MAQETSALWKELLTRNGVRRDYRFLVTAPDGETVTYLTAQDADQGEVSHHVSQSLFEQFGIGNAVSARLDLTILADDIPRGAKIQRQVRLRDDDTGEASEWLPKGTFWPNRRQEEDGLWTVEAWDAIRKAEVPWMPKQSLDFPLSARTAVDIFADLLGVEVDERTKAAMSSVDYTLDYPTSDPENETGDNFTIRRELCAIAAAYGGNFVMSDEGKLLLIPLLAWQEEDAVRHDIGLSLVSDTDGKTLPPVSRVTFSVDSEHVYSASSIDPGLELTASVMGLSQPDASRAVSQVLAKLNGFTYQMFTAEAVSLDPAAELGDGVIVGGEDSGITSTRITSFLARIEDDGSGYPDISAPGDAEAPDEMPVAGPMSQAFAHQLARTYSVIDKTAESITLGIYQTINDEGIDADGEQRLAEFFLGINNIRHELFGDGEEYEGLRSIVDQLPDSISSTIYRTINDEGVDADGEQRLAEFFMGINEIRTELYGDGDEYAGLRSIVTQLPDSISSTIYSTINNDGKDADGEQRLAEFFMGINNIRLQLWGTDEDGTPRNPDSDTQVRKNLVALFDMTPNAIVEQVEEDSWIRYVKIGVEGIEATVQKEIYGEGGSQKDPKAESPYQVLQSKIILNEEKIEQEVSDREAGDHDLSARITVNANSITQEISDRTDGDAESVRTATTLIRQLSDSIFLSVEEITGTGGERHASITLTVDGVSHGLGNILLDGNVDVSGAISAEALYSLLGIVADLIVNCLKTSDRVRKYLARDTSDDHYQYIHGETHEYISGTYAGGEEQATEPNGLPLYWQDDPSHGLGADGYPIRENGTRIYTTTEVTEWPVMQYTYTDEVKLAIRFEEETTAEGGTIYTPTIILGAGNAAGTNQARIQKSTDGLRIMFTPNSDEESGPRDDIGIHMTLDGYLDFYGQRRTTALDFSGWTGEGTGTYTEMVQGEATPRTNTVTFDGDGRPVKITDSDGFEMTITW